MLQCIAWPLIVVPATRCLALRLGVFVATAAIAMQFVVVCSAFMLASCCHTTLFKICWTSILFLTLIIAYTVCILWFFDSVFTFSFIYFVAFVLWLLRFVAHLTVNARVGGAGEFACELPVKTFHCAKWQKKCAEKRNQKQITKSRKRKQFARLALLK